jgi:hypothetical protein
MTIEPDTKDWTWVLARPCPECGFDAAVLDRETLPERLRANAARWRPVLADEDAAVRPAGNVWSPLEYACHVRDVHRIFAGRLTRMLTEDGPAFENWDQDATAEEQGYGGQDPATVADELVEAADRVADVYAGVTGERWNRTGRRSDGTVFSVDGLGRYHLHDVEHHVVDVRS